MLFLHVTLNNQTQKTILDILKTHMADFSKLWQSTTLEIVSAHFYESANLKKQPLRSQTC